MGYDPNHAPTGEMAAQLSGSNPRLRELAAAYALDQSPMSAKSLWSDELVADDVHLHYFRGDNLYVWQYTRSPIMNRYRNFIYAKYLAGIDERGLLGQLEEDGAFGCLTWEYAGLGVVSRDLLDSIAELTFLDAHAGLFDRPGLRVLDIGAGYGRLAHRMLMAAPNVSHYYCVDAVPRSTFLSELYMKYRGLGERATVIELPDVTTALRPGHIDLAVNIHSFSEMPLTAIRGWLRTLCHATVPQLLVVPNEAVGLTSRELDGTRIPCLPVFEEVGYRLRTSTPTIQDPAVSDLLDVRDNFLFFELDEPKARVSTRADSALG